MWGYYDQYGVDSAPQKCSTGNQYLNGDILGSSQWCDDGGYTCLDLDPDKSAETKSTSVDNREIREIPEIVNEIDLRLQPSESAKRNILIEPQNVSVPSETSDILRQALKRTGKLRAILKLDTENLLAIYYDIRSSTKAYDMINNGLDISCQSRAKFVNILSPNVYFDVCNRYYENEEGIDHDYIRNPENNGRIQIFGLQSKVDPVIESIINMFGGTISVKKLDFDNNFGLEVEYYDIRKAQSAYDSLSGCEYGEGHLKVTFCPVAIGEPSEKEPQPTLHTHKLISPPISKIGDSPASDQKTINQKNNRISFSSVASRDPPANKKTMTYVVSRVMSRSGECHAAEKRALNLVDTPESIPILKPLKEIPSGSNNLFTNLPVVKPSLHSLDSKKSVNDLGNELNLEDIESGADKRTTFMIRNIPNKYTQCMLISFLNSTHKGLYDFLYLRMDFKNRCNVGYAFINFYNKEAIVSFVKRMMGRKW